MDNIRKMIDNLSWHKPEDLQKLAINQLEFIDDHKLPLLVQPNSKECWENAAKFLGKIGYPRVKFVMPELLKWLQDMNWPGAWTILEILEGIAGKELVSYIESALIHASKENDAQWISGIKELVERTKLKERDFSSHEVFLLLELGD